MACPQRRLNFLCGIEQNTGDDAEYLSSESSAGMYYDNACNRVQQMKPRQNAMKKQTRKTIMSGSGSRMITRYMK